MTSTIDSLSVDEYSNDITHPSSSLSQQLPMSLDVSSVTHSVSNLSLEAQSSSASTVVDTQAIPLAVLKNALLTPSSLFKPNSSNNVDIESNVWKSVLENAIHSIVSIKYIITRNLDTWHTGSYTATGFIVDVEKGLILTNKHVVTDAPFIGRVCFKNSEEVPVWPVWRDPIHDFGFLQFDPSQVKFMKLVAVPLKPESAKVGLQVRVPGSDAGEKLAVLSGIIARIDRPAANYGKGSYNDFNTFYIQASANTSGGSSGSPVIDIHGNAVALNAGGSTKAASSFFLPLERVKRALEILQKGELPTRGTIQVEIIQKQFDECRRLGLPLDIESTFRNLNPELNGLLAIKHVIPGGPADGYLHVGDIIVQCDGQFVNHFVDLAAILDEKVVMLRNGEKMDGKDPFVDIVIFRNKKLYSVDIPVQDLETITPNYFIDIAGTIVHPLSFQMARSFLHPVDAVFVADAGQMFGIAGIPAHSIIMSVAHTPVRNVQEFISVMTSLERGKRVPVRYYLLSKKNVEMVKVISIDLDYGDAACFRRADRDDKTGLWKYTNIPSNSTLAAPTSIKPFVARSAAGNKSLSGKLINSCLPFMCVVESHCAFGIDGYAHKWCEGNGVILDTKHGLVLVDHATSPTANSKIYVNFANNVIVPGKIVWTHPLHGYVMIRYDVDYLIASIGYEAACGGKFIQSCSMSDLTELQIGAEALLVTMNTTTHLARVLKTQVKSKGYFIFGDHSPPRFRPINWDNAVTFHHAVGEETGVLVDKQAKVRGFLFNHSKSLMAHLYTEQSDIKYVLDRIVAAYDRFGTSSLEASKHFPQLRLVDVEFSETYYWKARELGLSEEWINQIDQERVKRLSINPPLSESATHEEAIDDVEEGEWSSGGEKYSVITVRRIPASWSFQKNEQFLMEGDLILAINDQVVTSMHDLHLLHCNENVDSAKAIDTKQHALLSPFGAVLKVFRDGKMIDLNITPRTLDCLPQTRVVHWAGACFQMPHHPVYFHVKHIPKGVYISLIYNGSPAQRDGLNATWFITEIDGQAIENLDDLLAVVEGQNWQDVVQTTTMYPSEEPAHKEHSVGEDAQHRGANDSELDPTVIREHKSFRVTMVSLEQVHRVVTVDVSFASKLYFPTWNFETSS